MAKVNMMSLREDPPTKVARIRFGYSANGQPIYAAVDLKPNEEVCKQCEGTGRIHFNAAYDGFERIESCQCENCDGEGVIYSETEENDDD